ncbi:MAG: signal peptidase II [Alphaproteobacteria bacterium]|nr:signal peptidase II [Alphaproteobacteria bacterium]
MKKYIKYVVGIAIFFIADFMSKIAITHFLANKYGDMVYSPSAICAKCKIEGIYIPWEYILQNNFGLSKFFNVVFVWNTGASFSVFRSVGMIAPMVIVCLTSLVVGGLLFYLFGSKSKDTEKWPLALIIGGALGNIVDRIQFGAVADFIQMNLFGWHFPAIFNIGDVFITIGAIWFIIVLIVNKFNNKGK